MNIYEFFDNHGIDFERVDHAPVYTTEDSERIVPEMEGAGTKNLFVRDKKPRRHILISVCREKMIDLKAFKKLIDCPSNLSIASEKRLLEYLGVETGAVSLLSVINDPEDIVEVYIDKDLWESEYIKCHPLVNTSTVKLPQKDIENIFSILSHNYKVMKIPVK